MAPPKNCEKIRIVFPLAPTIKKEKKLRILRKEEKNCLLSPIKHLNVRYAERKQLVGYLELLNQKIDTIRECSNFGKNYNNIKLNFGTEFTYKVFLEMFSIMEDYICLKDHVAYTNHNKEVEEYEKTLCDCLT